MMTIDEFKRSAATARRREGLGVMLAMAGMFAYMFAGVLAAKLLGVGPSRGKPAHPAVMVAVMGGAFVVLFGGIGLGSRWAQPTTGTACPNCGKSLGNSARIVIASRNCPHCGRRVLEEPDEG